MRLPSGQLAEIATTFIGDASFLLIGCLSPEQRCCAVPERLYGANCVKVELLEIIDPPNAFPNYSVETKERIEQNRQFLQQLGIPFSGDSYNLLATEDELIDLVTRATSGPSYDTVVLDISSFPKRFFCFILKRLLLRGEIRNVIVTITSAGLGGYTAGRLAEDPMTCDHLPGFAPKLPPENAMLVISIGFEPLNLRSLVDIYNDKRIGSKLLVPFPPNGDAIRRTWSTIRQIAPEPQEVRGNIEVIASWDAEQVYRTLSAWHTETGTLTLAPFGAKAHSLGMTLFAIEKDVGLFYTQPKSYHPEYSQGKGGSWGYVAKWNGVACYDRTVVEL